MIRSRNVVVFDNRANPHFVKVDKSEFRTICLEVRRSTPHVYY
jgi:hypothetical protein